MDPSSFVVVSSAFSFVLWSLLSFWHLGLQTYYQRVLGYSALMSVVVILPMVWCGREQRTEKFDRGAHRKNSDQTQCPADCHHHHGINFDFARTFNSFSSRTQQVLCVAFLLFRLPLVLSAIWVLVGLSSRNLGISALLLL